jgi:RNA polymerase-binding protein DksA
MNSSEERAPAGAASRAAKTAPAKREASGGSPAPAVTVNGPESWTAAEVEELRAALVSDVERLRVEIDAAQAERQMLMRDYGDGSGEDQADAGSKTFEREQEMSLVNNAMDMLAQDERALARLDDGSYGNCEGCGEPIGKARLQAFPRATLCLACKQRQERR